MAGLFWTILVLGGVWLALAGNGVIEESQNHRNRWHIWRLRRTIRNGPDRRGRRYRSRERVRLKADSLKADSAGRGIAGKRDPMKQAGSASALAAPSKRQIRAALLIPGDFLQLQAPCAVFLRNDPGHWALPINQRLKPS